MLFFIGGLIATGVVWWIAVRPRLAAQPIPVRIEEEYYRQ